MARRSAQRRARRSTHPFLHHEPRELRGRVRICRARARCATQVPMRLAGSPLEACPPREKSTAPSPDPTLTRPSYVTPAERSRERAGPGSTARTAACRTPSTAARTRGSRRSRPSRTAGEPRLPVRRVSKHESAPSSVAPRAFPGAFRPKRLGVPRVETRERNDADRPVSTRVSRTQTTGPSKPPSRPGVPNRPRSSSLHVSVR